MTKDQAIAPNAQNVSALADYLIAKGWRLQDCKVCGESASAYVAPAPDCRTCQQYQEDEGICLYPLNHGLKQCTNGDQYQPAPKAVLWRTES
jgi:hypothetical protein